MTGPPAAGRPVSGAQPERTRLAWRRTTLAFAVAAALAVRSAMQESGRTVSLAMAALGVLAWLVFLVVAHRRIRRLAEVPDRLPPGAPVRAATLCTLTLVLFGVVLLW